MTNRRNRWIYRLWAPVYDATVGHFFLPGRERAIELLGLQSGEFVLLVGAGTGADLPLLPEGVRAVGVDISPEMLHQASRKLDALRDTLFVLGDAQKPPFATASFDAIAFSLILSVIPDGGLCLRENLRLLKPGGRVVVFDKFAPEQCSLSRRRKLLNLGSTLFGTDITRRFGELSEGCGLRIVCDEPSLMNGAYRVILLCEN